MADTIHVFHAYPNYIHGSLVAHSRVSVPMLPTVDVLVAIISSPAHISQYLSMCGTAGMNELAQTRKVCEKHFKTF